jgi:O-antigen/teichoic acid export membrane protein
MTGLINRARGEPRPSPAPAKPRGLMANSASLFASRIIVAILAWSGTIIVVRNLSHTEWGEFTFVFSFLGLAAIVSNVVNSQVALHGLLQPDADRFAGSYVILRGLLGLLAYSIAVTFVVVAGYSTVVVEATALGGLIVIIATPSIGFDAIFTVQMRMDRVAVAGVLGQLVQFAAIAIIAVLGGSVVLFTIPTVLCEIVILWWKLGKLRGMQRVRYVPDVRRWGKLLRAAAPLAVGFAAATAYYSLDSVMLSKLDTFRAVGTYGIAYKFAGIVGFIPSVFCGVLLAVLIRSWPNAKDAFFDALRRASAVLLLIALMIAVEFVLFAGPAIRLLYSSQYVGAAGATRLVIGGECIGFFTTLGVTVYATFGRNRLYAIAAIAGLVVNFVANLYVIPRYSYHGAAWVTLGTEIVVVTVLWVPLLRLLGRSPISAAMLVKALLVGAMSFAAGWVLRDAIPWPAAAVIVATVFIVGMHLARVPDRGGLISLLRDDNFALDEPNAVAWRAPEAGLIAWYAGDHTPS